MCDTDGIHISVHVPSSALGPGTWDQIFAIIEVGAAMRVVPASMIAMSLDVGTLITLFCTVITVYFSVDR
jgi:hypothetical protein